MRALQRLGVAVEQLGRPVHGVHRHAAVDLLRELDETERVAERPDLVGQVVRVNRYAVAADAGYTGTRPVAVPALLRFGSWIGADRDGHPGVTADVTLQASRLQSDHLLRGYEAVATRLMASLAARVPPEGLDRALGSALARDAEELPETVRQLRGRFPDEPYRQRMGAIAERLRRTRASLTGGAAARAGGYPDAAALEAELEVLSDALVTGGLGRVAWGDVADLRWQLETFGFHLASLEVRQHADVHLSHPVLPDAAELPYAQGGGDIVAQNEVQPGVNQLAGFHFPQAGMFGQDLFADGHRATHY